ncbi:hypothetical protein ACFSHQ_25340 [Gemmobacter lanyuensis]
MTRRDSQIAASDSLTPGRISLEKPAAEKIVRRKLSDQVFDRLRELIARGNCSRAIPCRPSGI